MNFTLSAVTLKRPVSVAKVHPELGMKNAEKIAAITDEISIGVGSHYLPKAFPFTLNKRTFHLFPISNSIPAIAPLHYSHSQVGSVQRVADTTTGVRHGFKSRHCDFRGSKHAQSVSKHRLRR